jgi:hypothetical protein
MYLGTGRDYHSCGRAGNVDSVAVSSGGAMAEHKHAQQQLQIQLDDDMAQGVYANMAMVNHTETEFTLDFIYVQPHQPKAKVRSRIITNPKHMKRLLLAIQENVGKYEARFGNIDVSGPGPGDLTVN